MGTEFGDGFMQRRRRQMEDRNGSNISVAKRKELFCQQDDNSQGNKRLRYKGPGLPDDIWHYIHSLMPLRDAARVACVSRAFLNSWGCHPNLIFNEDTLGFYENEDTLDFYYSTPGKDFIKKVGCILKNNQGINTKTFRLEVSDFDDVNVRHRHLNSWLHSAVKPGIQEITLRLIIATSKYNFPCSILSDGTRNSIQRLQLRFCVFRPPVEIGSFKSLIKLHLDYVRITGDELGCLLAGSLVLEHSVLRCCPEIVCLKIHCMLLSRGWKQVKILLGEALKMKEIHMHRVNVIRDTLSEFPSIVPNLASLTICSIYEVVNTPMLTNKFLYLKYLTITLFDWGSFASYDYFSLVSMLDASPSLETFVLNVSQQCMEHVSIFEDFSHTREMPKHHHNNLKSVKIIGFCSAKSLIELACHIVANAVSLDHLTLDTTNGYNRCSCENYNGYPPRKKDLLMEVPRALLAIKEYIEGKVPSSVICSGAFHPVLCLTVRVSYQTINIFCYLCIVIIVKCLQALNGFPLHT